MSRQAPTEDLLVLARQCKLSEEEERRFELAVQASRELECLYDAGVHFDHAAGLVSGDETRVRRLVERTLERLDPSAGLTAARAASAASALPRAARPSRASLIARYFAVSLAFGVLLCVTLASAWDYVETRALQRAQQAQQARESSARAALKRASAAAPAPAPASAPAPAVATQSPLPDTRAGLPRSVPATLSPPSKAASADEKLSSSELFARANQARRKGDIEQAISLYERLGRAYPSSLEAADAKILSGNLLLSQRSPRAALRQFEDYHAGALSLEALWGRARALRELESPDERAVLVELIRDYPDSAYAKAAEKRLAELSR
ncbi:MAG TPA: tetratricopeptide repeat protein [Polyangiaceae bacterium]|jgi:TolA-binding protein